MNGSSGVLALVLAEAAAGGVALLFLTPLWGEVKRGFFYLTGGIVIVFALSAAGSAGNGSQFATPETARVASISALSLAGATLIGLGLIGLGRPAVGRAFGLLAVLAGIGTCLLFASALGEASVAIPAFQLVGGAFFLGAVLDGLLLGHWYLTDRRLPRGPINRMTWLLIAAVAVEAVAVLTGLAIPQSSSASISPLLTVSGNATWIAFGMVACTGLIAAFIKATLKGTRPQAVQSATGFFYLALITAFTAELAAKVRFLR